MADNNWRNGVGRTAVDYRPGGPGNNWVILDMDGVAVDTSSGGRKSVESEWRQSAFGQEEYLGTRFTSNPARWTFNLMSRIKYLNFVQGLINDGDERVSCACDYSGNDYRVRERCGDKRELTNYEMARAYMDAYSTSDSYSRLADYKDGTDELSEITLSMSAGKGYSYKKLKHLDISAAVSTTAINRVRYVCGKEWWGCTDGVAATSPGNVVWTDDDGASWSTDSVDVFANGSNATDIVVYGDRIIVASGAEAPAYALRSDVKAGSSGIWTLGTGITTNFPSKLAVTPDGTLWGTGAGGRVWKSTDLGYTWSVFNAGTVSSSDMNAVLAVSPDLVWFGGAGGDLMRYYKGVLSAVTVSGLSDDIMCIAVPQGRDEVFLGTDGGDIYRSVNASASAPTFTTPGFQGAGSGVITDLQFAGFRGDVLFVLQTTADPYSRVLRDLSGGALGRDVEIIGTYADPANSGMNSLAAANQNIALTVGEVDSTYAFIGKVSGF